MSSPTPQLARRASRGFIWLFLNTASSKLISFVGQLILARLLVPRDFGLIGLALTVTAFTGLVEQAGLTEILVQRQKEFDRWVTPAFWLALCFGLGSACVETAAAPIAARLYGEPRLELMLFILAASSPFAAMQSVTRATFLAKLDFRLVAISGVAQSISQTALTIVFAAMGYGALSFVLPYPIVAVGGLIFQWVLARPKINWHIRPSEWRYLVGDSARMLTASGIVMLTSQGDYMVLGILQPAAVVGLYVLAFNLSSQAITLLTRNVAKVLFPTLSKVQSDLRVQTRMYLSVASMLAILGAPIAFMQAAAADAIIHIAFQPKWYPAIPYLQILSIAMVFRTVGSTAGSLLQAQGRFSFRMKLAAGYASIFFLLLAIGYAVAGVIGLATGVCAYYLLTGLVHPRIVIRAGGGTWSDIVNVFAAPIGVAVASVGASTLVAHMLFDDPPHYIAKLLVIGIGTVCLYIPGIRLFLPSRYHQIADHLGRIRSFRTPRLET
jgi:PST family polysaccharide transporter